MNKARHIRAVLSLYGHYVSARTLRHDGFLKKFLIMCAVYDRIELFTHGIGFCPHLAPYLIKLVRSSVRDLIFG